MPYQVLAMPSIYAQRVVPHRLDIELCLFFFFFWLLLYTHVLVQIPYDINQIIAFKIVTPIFFCIIA